MDSTVTVFLDERRIASGSRDAVTRLIEERYAAADHGAIQVFDDITGHRVDLEHGDAGAGAARLHPRPRGRPKLGVKAREVTLLPRHWEWLGGQRGGASATLRRLVEQASREAPDRIRARRDAAYRFMQATSGDRPGYEEALRALYRGDERRLDALIADWPADVVSYVRRLLSDGKAQQA